MKESPFPLRPLRKRKFISKSLDNKQKNQGKRVKKKTLFTKAIEELRSTFYGKSSEDPIEIESAKSAIFEYV